MMKSAQPKNWTRDEWLEAASLLTCDGSFTNTGDLSECPNWVAVCALRYLQTLSQAESGSPEVEATVFQARTPYERRMKSKIAVARADLWERQDWLNGKADPRLLQRFGRVSVVPDWVRVAAVRDLQQQIFNLSTGQRLNPAVRNPV